MSAAYARSFAALCAGTVDFVLDELAAPPDRQCTLLDVGCGTGELAVAATAQRMAVMAADPDPDMVALARDAVDRAGSADTVTVVEAGLPDLPFADGEFDRVAANFVVNHLPDPRAGVRELARVTRPGGRVAMTTWVSGELEPSRLFADAMAEVGVTSLPGQRLAPELDFDRSPEGLARLAAEAGLVDAGARLVEWTWHIALDDIWEGVAGGVGVAGRTYLAQDEPTRARLEAAYRDLARRHVDPDGGLTFRALAALGGGVRA